MLPAVPYRLAGLGELDTREKQLLPVFMALTVAYGLTIVAQADYGAAWIIGLPLFLISFPVARGREQLFWLPWGLLAAQAIAWFLPRWQLQEDGRQLLLLDDVLAAPFLGYLLVAGLATSALAGWYWTTSRFRASWAALATLGPYILLTLGYLLTSRLLESWHWGLGTAALSLAVMIVATQSRRSNSIDSLVVWLFVAGHYGLALSAAMVFNEASLTLAIALQMVSLAWIIRSFELPALDWLLKLVVGSVIVRLTFNPWLASYPAEIHWPLFSYGGSFICAVAAMQVLKPYQQIARWCEGAALHLFVLTIFAEVRYQFHDGAVFAAEYTFWEACIYMSLFASLGLVYYRRSLVSETLARLYRWFAMGLAGLGVLNYLLILANTIDADRWIVAEISDTPIANGMLAAFGLPVLLGGLYWLFFMPRFRRAALMFAGLAGFIFVSLQVRHLWSGTVNLSYPAASDAELYTYSAVWLVIAIGTMLAGSWRLGRDCYRAGVALLGLVIIKLFFVDMSDLEGLLRVASFMGLGLSLLAVSYVHQRLTANHETPDVDTPAESRPENPGGA